MPSDACSANVGRVKGPRTRLLSPAICSALFVSCHSRLDSSHSAPAKSATVPAVTSARGPKQEPLAGELIDIPGGAFRPGSIPGDPGRDPTLEPRSFEIELGPFQIDRYPYPNDPKASPITGVARDDARRLCAARGARLCTELEWERACKGPDSEPYAGGAAWDPRCATAPTTCASGFDVVSMGGALREWASSDVLSGGSQADRAVVRGARSTAPGPTHRCAARVALDPKTKADDLGFRCCKGAPNAAVVPEPKLLPTYDKPSLALDRLASLLKSDPTTEALAKDVKYFREPDAAKTVLDRGPGDSKGFEFTVAPLLWHPAAGAEFLLVTGRSGEDTSFVAAYWALGADKYKLAASFVMKREPGPVAFAYDAYIRPRLHFSTCWGCPGETGKILFREPDGVAIVQP